MLTRVGASWRVCTKDSPSPCPFSSTYSAKNTCFARCRSSSYNHTLRKPGTGARGKHGRSSVARVGIALGCALGGSIGLDRLNSSFKESFTTPDIVSTSQSSTGRSFAYETETRSGYPGRLEMAGTTQSGHPGNLTAEQEARLQDMWLATLKVFGVSTSEEQESLGMKDGAGSLDGNSTPPSNDAQKPRSDTLGPRKTNKKRISIFGRRQRADAQDADDAALGRGTTTHRDAGIPLPEGDDKYGQNKDFAHALASESPENLRRAFWSMVKHDHPDGLLLRFLRARKWDVEKALVMLVSTMHWRMQEMHVDDDIMKRGEGGAIEDSRSADPAIKKEANDFLAQLRMGKSFLHGIDNEGRPMCFVRVRLHKQGEQSEASLERYTVFVIESARMLLASPVETAVSVE